MAKTTQFYILHFLLVAAVIFQISAVASAFGINYGTLGKLQPPQQVVDFIKTKTTIESVKIFDANPDILRALAGTGINVTMMVPNGNIPTMVDVANARQWVAANVLPFHQQTKIKYLCVGNEILSSQDNNLITNLVPAMQSLTEALETSGLADIKVTTPHPFTIVYNRNSPSLSRFNDTQKDFFTKILKFHRQTKSPFMINAYTYFMMDPNNVNYAIFGSSNAITDPNTGHTYNNMFDAVMDAIYSAINALGYNDVDFTIGETGWPTACDAAWCSPQNAATYNLNIIKRSKVIGTPLMPNRYIDIYLFALFNEDGKPGPTCERNWGLFKPDFSPVYDIGILRDGYNSSAPSGSPISPPSSAQSKWCVAKEDATKAQLQANIDWVCSQGIDCNPISPGGGCFDNNNLRSRSTFIMNAYYQSKACADDACNFSGSGIVSNVNPSTGSCVVPSSPSGAPSSSPISTPSSPPSGSPTSPPSSTQSKWCVAKEDATEAQLQANIDWVCSQGIDCKPISPGGGCFDNNNLRSRSTFIMNAYYQSKACADDACNFSGSGIVSNVNPSTGSCVVPSAPSSSPISTPSSPPSGSPTSPTSSAQSKWCVAKEDATEAQLQANIDWVCSQGIDCKPISPGGGCFDNNNLRSRSTFIMNAYYQSKACADDACNFSGSGIVSIVNPSTGSCVVPSSPSGAPSSSPISTPSSPPSGSPTSPPSSAQSKWCVAKEDATEAQLQANIDWVCSQGIDCKPISPGGGCFDNNNLRSRSTFIMNAYYQSKACVDDACNFSGSGIVSNVNPSTGSCVVPSAPSSTPTPSGTPLDPPSSVQSKWCVAKEDATKAQLQKNIDWVCSQGINCKPISPGGGCFDNNNLRSRSTFVMNAYYQSKACVDDACNFSGSGIVSNVNPSTGTCIIPSAPSEVPSSASSGPPSIPPSSVKLHNGS